MNGNFSLLLLGSAIAAALLASEGASGNPRPARYLLAQAQPPDAIKEPVTGRGVEQSDLARPEADRARLTGVRFVSSPSYTRVTMDLTQAAHYEVRRLKEDVAKGLPPRIYIDIFRAKLAVESKEPLVVDDGLLRHVRVGQFTPDVVRVVLDMNSLRAHNTFLLPDPYRLVIDIQGQKGSDNVAAIEKGKTSGAQGRENKRAAPATAVRKVVLDPGHGGKDPGAIGAGGIAEKDIVLSVAKKLARKLKREMGIEVVLTRKEDTFVPLEDRTAIANAEDADLFISLHMNASPNGDARGLETYYLDNTNDEAAIRLAARENGTSRKNVSDLQFILSDMTQNMKLEDSITLAHRLQGSLVNGMATKLGDVRDLGVKKALFYVLVGARMPSVLVEMFFITNKAEGAAMRQEKYQNAIVDALYEGILKYNQSQVAMKTL
jgi:N-acetylmuramoyl-L-alanine amidase